jgi:hypothetical protein
LYSEIKGSMKETASAFNGYENKKVEEKAQRRSEKSSARGEGRRGGQAAGDVEAKRD